MRGFRWEMILIKVSLYKLLEEEINRWCCYYFGVGRQHRMRQTLLNELEVVERMKFDRGFISPYFITNAKTQEVELENPLILLVEKKISNIQQILPFEKNLYYEKIIEILWNSKKFKRNYQGWFRVTTRFVVESYNIRRAVRQKRKRKNSNGIRTRNWNEQHIMDGTIKIYIGTIYSLFTNNIFL